MDERPTPRRSASSRSGGRRSPVRRAPDETRVWIWAITASGTEGGLRIRARPMLVMSTGDQTSGSIQTRPRSCQGGYHGMRLPWKPRCAFPVGRAPGSLDWISSRPGQVHRTRRLDCARRCRDGAVEVARAPGRGEPETGGLAQLSPPIVERAERLVDPRGRPYVEEGRALRGQELPPITLLHPLLPLAGSQRLLVSADAVLVIDGRVLDGAARLVTIACESPPWGNSPPLIRVST